LKRPSQASRTPKVAVRVEETAVQAIDLAYRAVKPIAVAALIVGLGMPFSAHAETAAPKCDAPLHLLRLSNPLTRFAQKLATRGPITIVAIGSSSTAGAGASSTAKNYPSQLAVELKRLFPTHSITVLNRGVNGEEVGDMLKRFDKDVVVAKPDLVLWQLGTNSVIRDQMFTDHGAAIRDGLNKIRAVGADVVLIDPQFAPKVIVKADAEHMVELIATTAKVENVDLFRRFDVMKRWRDADHMSFESFVSPDGLHMNDWSYACMAKGLGMAITEAAQRPVMSAKAHLVP
jgi:lysophospholipase L1-like esterase